MAEQKEITCNICNRKVTSISALNRHRESKHSKSIESCICRICHKQFKTKWSLSTHTSRFHRKNETINEPHLRPHWTSNTKLNESSSTTL